MLRFSGCSQNPCSSVLDELQLSSDLLWKETITIIHPAADKGHEPTGERDGEDSSAGESGSLITK